MIILLTKEFYLKTIIFMVLYYTYKKYILYNIDKQIEVENIYIFRKKFLQFENLVIAEEYNDIKLLLKIKELKDKHGESYYLKYDFTNYCLGEDKYYEYGRV